MSRIPGPRLEPRAVHPEGPVCSFSIRSRCGRPRHHRGPSTESQQHHPGPAGKSRGPGSSPSDTNPEAPHTDTEERASSTCDVDMGLRTPSSKQEAHAACEERRSSDGRTMSKGHPRGRAVMGRGGLRPPWGAHRRDHAITQPTRGLDRQLLLGQVLASGGVECESWTCHEPAA